VLGLFPSWLASESDWPKQLRLVGFPLTDQAAGGYTPDAAAALEQLPPALREFIMSSAKDNVPVYAFTAGSAPPPYAAAFFATAVEACRLAGARCVLLCGVASLVPQPLAAHACHEAFAPFSALLQHVSVFTFNGGIGGVSQALRAGTPMVRKRVHMSAAARRRARELTPSAALASQLIVPGRFDQPDNAARLLCFGVGAVLDMKEFTPRRAAAALEALRTSSTTRAACRQLAQHFVGGGSQVRVHMRVLDTRLATVRADMCVAMQACVVAAELVAALGEQRSAALARVPASAAPPAEQQQAPQA
jgi:hypothetical protein